MRLAAGLLSLALAGCRWAPAGQSPVLLPAPASAPTSSPVSSAPASSPAPPGWAVRNPGPVTEELLTAAFITERLVFAAGAGGAVVRSGDGGASWERVSAPLAAEWRAVGRAKDGAVWLAGACGERLRSEDAGESWAVISRAGPCVAAPPEDPAGAGRVFEDALGRSWILAGALEEIAGEALSPRGAFPGAPSAFALAGPRRAFSGGGVSAYKHFPVGPDGAHGGYIESEGVLSRSDDLGASWSPVAAGLPGEYVRYIAFDAAGRGVVLGGPTGCPRQNRPLLETDDAGETFRPAGPWVESKGAPPSGPAGLCVPDERERRVRCTWDGGRRWFGGPYPGPVLGRSCPEGFAVAFRDLDAAVAVGRGGRIYRMEGGRWVSKNRGPVGDLFAAALSGDAAIAAGERVLFSRDRGASWRDVTPPLSLPAELAPLGEYLGRWQAAALLDPDTAFVGAGLGGVRYTEDGGRTWADRSSGLPAFSLGVGAGSAPFGVTWLYFFDRDRGLAASFGGLYATSDGGRRWEAVPLPARGEPLTLAAVLPAAPPVVLISDRRRLYRSVDGGRSFSDATAALGEALAAHGISLLIGAGAGGAYAVLGGGAVLRSDDAGASWRPFSYGVEEPRQLVGARAARGGLEVFNGGGASYLIGASAVTVAHPSALAKIPGGWLSAVVFDDAGGLGVGAAGLIATLGR